MIKLIKIIKEDSGKLNRDIPPDDNTSNPDGSTPPAHDYDKLDDFISIKKGKRAISFDDLKAVKSSLFEIGKNGKTEK